MPSTAYPSQSQAKPSLASNARQFEGLLWSEPITVSHTASDRHALLFSSVPGSPPASCGVGLGNSLHKIYHSLLKCLPSPSGEEVERRKRSYPHRTDRAEWLSFHPLKFRGSTVSLTLKSTNQILLVLIGRMRIPDESHGMVWLPALCIALIGTSISHIVHK